MFSSLNDDLRSLILAQNFKIDTLLPNYLILQKLHPEYQHVSHQTLKGSHLKAYEDIYDTIYELVFQTFKNTTRLYMRSTKSDRIPNKHKLLSSIEVFVNQETKSWLQKENLQEIRSRIIEELIKDTQVYLFALSQLQNVYSEFFSRQFFNEVETHNVLDDVVNMDWFSITLENSLSHYLKQVMGTSKGLTYDLVFDQMKLQELTYFMNDLITTYYNECRQYLIEAVKEFTDITENSIIMNKYMIIGLLHELSSRSYQLIENYLLYSVFQNSDIEVRKSLAHFIIFNFDSIRLINDKLDHKSQFEGKIIEAYKEMSQNYDIDESMDEIFLEHRFVEIFMNKTFDRGEQIVLHHVINKRTKKIGIHIQAKQKNQVAFIVHKPLDKIIILNAKIVPTQWTFISSKQLGSSHVLDERLDTATEYQSIEHVFNENEFAEHMVHVHHQRYKDKDHTDDNVQNGAQNASVQTNLGYDCTGGTLIMSGAACDVGATLGYCLANINRYQSKKEFFKDFGTMAAMNGSITYLALTVPILGQLIAVGGFGYFAMRIHKNQTASKQSKSDQYSKLMIGAGTGIGTSVGGCLLGQALIPVPVLGALIGGFIGGLTGGVSINILFEHMNEKKAERIVVYLEARQRKEGDWKLTSEGVSMMCLSQDYFKSKCPGSLKYDQDKLHKWFTIICYGFLSLFYTQKEELLRQQKQIERVKHQKQQKGKKVATGSFKSLPSSNDLEFTDAISEKSLHTLDQDFEFQDDEEELDDEVDYHFDWPASIEKSHQWLLSHNTVVLHAIKELQEVLQATIRNL